MGTYTEKLNLYKTNMLTDGNDLFNFKRDLDDNWDKIDAGFATLDTKCDGKQDKLTAGYNIDIESNTISASGKYPYSFNNGNVDSSGNADLISYSGSDVTYKIGNTYPNLVGTQADGQQFEVESITADDVTGLADGSYKKYVGSDGSAELLNNTLTIAKTEPTSPNDKDVWINNAVSPLSVKKYVSPNYTVVGSPTVNDGIIDTSSFSASDYVTAKLPISALANSGSWEINIPFKFKTLPPVGAPLGLLKRTSGDFPFQLGFNGNQLRIFISSNNSTWDIVNTNVNYTWALDTDYLIQLGFTGTKYYVNVNNTEIWSVSTTTKIYNTGNTDYTFGFWGSYTGIFYLDFVQFKIYADNTLVYVPNIVNGWVDYDKVPLGKITVSSGAVSVVESFPYNIDYIGAGGAMPTGAYKTLTVLASGGNYTAPANGYFYFSSSDGVLQIGNNATQSLGMTSNYVAGSPAYGAKVFCPVQKGQSVFLRYSGTVENAYFIYSKDSRNEAI